MRAILQLAAMPADQNQKQVHELVAVRERGLAKQLIVGMLEFADGALKKVQTKRRRGLEQAEQCRRRCGRVAGTKCLGAGPMLAACQK